MAKWICIFLFACLTTLAAEDFQFTRSFDNISFQFQMPTLPEEEKIEKCTYWISKTNNQTFTLGVKRRSCTEGTQPLKICDIAAFLRPKMGQDIRLHKNYRDRQNQWHWVFSCPDGKYLFFSFVGRKDATFVLMTETDDETDHQRFIESFVFSETPKPACCACCKAKGTQCSG